MKVTGFTFIRNAITYDYPIVEAILSILPICNEVVVAVGNSDDNTLSLIQNIDPSKIRIIETIWDDNLREGGIVLAKETDKAFNAIADDSDWAFYIQGDEVVHEKYLDTILKAMHTYKNDKNVDGLLFNYHHFYGSYDYIGSSLQWYQKEIRIIKNDKSIYSYRDAQGFRKENNKKLIVKPIDAFVYHYGWVKEPEAMQRKQENFNKLWHDDQWVEKNVVKATEYDYKANIDELKKFNETHPKIMLERIKSRNWSFDHDISFNKTSFKDKLKKILKKYLNIDSTYQNYKII